MVVKQSPNHFGWVRFGLAVKCLICTNNFLMIYAEKEIRKYPTRDKNAFSCLILFAEKCMLELLFNREQKTSFSMRFANNPQNDSQISFTSVLDNVLSTRKGKWCLSQSVLLITPQQVAKLWTIWTSLSTFYCSRTLLIKVDKRGHRI